MPQIPGHSHLFGYTAVASQREALVPLNRVEEIVLDSNHGNMGVHQNFAIISDKIFYKLKNELN